MSPRYKHTQIGYLLIVLLGSALFITLYLLMVTGFNWIAIIAVLILALCLYIFSTLTVTVTASTLDLYFTARFIHKQFPLDAIRAVRVVKNPWYYGWGIHRVPDGWVYNVSGTQAVELTLRNGRKERIGTDEPEQLAAAVRAATSTRQAP